MQTVFKKLRRELVMLLLFFLPEERKRTVERRLRGREEYRRLSRADCVVVSFGKSGRTWLRVMLSRYYTLRFGLPESELISFDNLHNREPEIPRVFFTHDNYVADHTGNRDSKCDFYDKKVVLLVRNPQDVAVSQFFQWKFRMKEHKKKINRYPLGDELPIFDFVMGEAAGVPKIIGFMNGWAEELARMQNVLVIRYEDMRADTPATFGRIVEFIDGRADAQQVAAAVEFASVDNMRKLETGKVFAGGRMKPGDAGNPDSYKVRRAKVGGYRDYFEDDQITRIDELVRSKLSPAFGYQAADERLGR